MRTIFSLLSEVLFFIDSIGRNPLLLFSFSVAFNIPPTVKISTKKAKKGQKRPSG
jgi:hypothetical protein